MHLFHGFYTYSSHMYYIIKFLFINFSFLTIITTIKLIIQAHVEAINSERMKHADKFCKFDAISSPLPSFETDVISTCWLRCFVIDTTSRVETI